MELHDFRQEFPGENQFIEFKTGLSREPLQESIVAFSNSQGGVILIGVADDGKVVGRELDAGTWTRFTRSSGTSMILGVIQCTGSRSMIGHWSPSRLPDGERDLARCPAASYAYGKGPGMKRFLEQSFSISSIRDPQRATS
jgi:hypothetical protein